MWPHIYCWPFDFFQLAGKASPALQGARSERDSLGLGLLASRLTRVATYCTHIPYYKNRYVVQLQVQNPGQYFDR